MKFHETNLSDNQLVEDAFDYSYANIMTADRAEILKDFARQIGMFFAQELHMLDGAKETGTMTEDEYKQEKQELQRRRDAQIKMGPRAIDDQLNNAFLKRRVAPAQELQNYSEKASPEMLAAVMLIECVRSPIDYLNIVKSFGDGVARLVAEVNHIDAYPSERDAALASSGSDIKRVYMALLITSLDAIVAQAKRMAEIDPDPSQKISFYTGQEELLFDNAKSMWGNDKKLDQRFLAAFNGAAGTTDSIFRMEIDADGDLELVKGNTLSPPSNPKFKPPGPGNNPDMGDDVF